MTDLNRILAARTQQFGLLSLSLILSACATQTPKPTTLADIEHIIVIYAENRSFDHLYGLFPGANGIANATNEQKLQIDHNGQPLPSLPPIWADKEGVMQTIDAKLPNQPFRIDAPPINMPLSKRSRDLVHRFYQHKEQINGGRNNRFAAVSDAGGLTMGYYDGSKLPLWQWAKDYVLADNFFMGAFGGSYLNHQWLICACTPVFATAPFDMRAQIDANGFLKRKPDSPASALQGAPKFYDGALSPDGYTVNTVQPAYQPSGIPPAANGDARLADDKVKHPPLPPQTQTTIGDLLSEKSISWAWYAGGYNQALADGMQATDQPRRVIYTDTPGTLNFQPHHQPFNYYARYAPGSAEREQHLRDGAEFLQALDNGQLPQVAFYKPTGDVNQHPGYSDVLSGDKHIAEILQKIKASPAWSNTVIIVAYDENGGFWDHVPPPTGDRFGPGSRIPALIISPFAKRGVVDHTLYDTTSILKLISKRFALTLLPGIRANAGDLTNALDLTTR